MILSLLVLPALLTQGPQIEWVVRDVKPPQVINDDYQFQYGPTWPFGAGSQEGITNWILDNWIIPDIWSGLEAHSSFDYFTGIGSPTVRRIMPNTELSTSGGRWATLATPTGTQVLISRYSLVRPSGLVSFDPSTGQEIGMAVPPTNLPNGIPDPGKFDSLFAAGDINGDGYEDCFWASGLHPPAPGYAYFGLLDGASLTVPWVQGITGASYVPPAFWEPQILPDLTGDGIADFFVGHNHSSLYTGWEGHTWELYSGVDGAIIWSDTDDKLNSIHFPYGRDLSGDGSPDAVVWEQGSLRGISVKDNVELWQASMDPVWNSAGLGEHLRLTTGTGGILFSHSLSATGNDHVVIPLQIMSLVGPLSDNRTGFSTFDAVDGTFLGTHLVHNSLLPWVDEDFTIGPSTHPIGDYDRDGLTEWYVRDYDEANSPPWAGWMYSERMVILGQRTLFVPATLTLTTTSLIDIDIAIPSAPNKNYQVLFSTAFDVNGGWEMEGWKTYLGTSMLLDRSLQGWQYSPTGTLDADGQATTYAIVPNYPPLIGRTLYSRAIIFNPAGSPEHIWTISSLGVTEIQ